MPLTKSGKEVMAGMVKQYGAKKGKQVFYASINKGKKGSRKWHGKKVKKGKIRSMRRGGLVKKASQLAMLHKGEQVIPAAGRKTPLVRTPEQEAQISQRRLARGGMGGGLGAEVNMREQRRLGIAQNARGPGFGSLMGGGMKGLGGMGGGQMSAEKRVMKNRKKRML